jgi:hypothetical protein
LPLQHSTLTAHVRDQYGPSPAMGIPASSDRNP